MQKPQRLHCFGILCQTLPKAADHTKGIRRQFLLCSGIKSVKNGNIDIAAVKNAMQEAFCKLDESSQNGTLEIEKYDGKVIAKAGGLKLELDICW